MAGSPEPRSDGLGSVGGFGVAPGTTNWLWVNTWCIVVEAATAIGAVARVAMVEAPSSAVTDVNARGGSGKGYTSRVQLAHAGWISCIWLGTIIHGKQRFQVCTVPLMVDVMKILEVRNPNESVAAEQEVYSLKSMAW